MSTYNGWANFETWKVNLEVFSGWDAGYLSADEAEEIAYFHYTEGVDDTYSLAYSVIRLFLDAVNYKEIAEAHRHDV